MLSGFWSSKKTEVRKQEIDLSKLETTETNSCSINKLNVFVNLHNCN